VVFGALSVVNSSTWQAPSTVAMCRFTVSQASTKDGQSQWFPRTTTHQSGGEKGVLCPIKWILCVLWHQPQARKLFKLGSHSAGPLPYSDNLKPQIILVINSEFRLWSHEARAKAALLNSRHQELFTFKPQSTFI